MRRSLLSSTAWSVDVAALVLRLVFCGLMVYYHAMLKYTLFGESPDSFPDPIGLGGTLSFYLVLFAEGICAALVLIGLFTRLALFPMMVSMTVALLRVHWDNQISYQELPLLYLAAFVALMWLGPGRWSVDERIFGRRFRGEI